MLHISGTIYHIFVIVLQKCKMKYSGTCFFHFFNITIFWVVSGVKGEKMAENNKKICVVLHILGAIYHMIVICGTQV